MAALEPRFTDTQDFPAESGSPGAREALLRPLAYAHREGGDARFPTAAVAFAIDRLRGRFAGGRWVFWLASAPPQDEEWTWLTDEATRHPVDFRVDPTFAMLPRRRAAVAHRPRASARGVRFVERSVCRDARGPQRLTERQLRGADCRGARHRTRAAHRFVRTRSLPRHGGHRARSGVPRRGSGSSTRIFSRQATSSRSTAT